MNSVLLTEKEFKSFIGKIINEVYRQGRSVNPADAKDMLAQFTQAYETEGPEGQTASRIYSDIWGFAMTALKSKVSAILGSQFDSFYYPDAVDKQFVEKKQETMKIIYDDCKNGRDVLYDLARFIANKLKDILSKNATRNSHHVMAADTRVDAENGTQKDIMDTLSNNVAAEDESEDILEKMKAYLDRFNGEMPLVIRQTLEDIITGIEEMDPNVKEEIMSSGATDKNMQQLILMTALGTADSEQTVPYPDLLLIISKYRKIALYAKAQRTGENPNMLQASPKDIKDAIVDKNPNGKVTLKINDEDVREYTVNDIMLGIDRQNKTRVRLNRLKEWFNQHDLSFEKMAQNARGIAEGKNRNVVRLTESQLKELVTKKTRNFIREALDEIGDTPKGVYALSAVRGRSHSREENNPDLPDDERMRERDTRNRALDAMSRDWVSKRDSRDRGEMSDADFDKYDKQYDAANRNGYKYGRNYDKHFTDMVERMADDLRMNEAVSRVIRKYFR